MLGCQTVNLPDWAVLAKGMLGAHRGNGEGGPQVQANRFHPIPPSWPKPNLAKWHGGMRGRWMCPCPETPQTLCGPGPGC